MMASSAMMMRHAQLKTRLREQQQRDEGEDRTHAEPKDHPAGGVGGDLQADLFGPPPGEEGPGRAVCEIPDGHHDQHQDQPVDDLAGRDATTAAIFPVPAFVDGLRTRIQVLVRHANILPRIAGQLGDPDTLGVATG